MNAEEYDNLENTERNHWYYSGKREMVRYWIDRTVRGGSRRTLLDCGAGTGLFAQEMAARHDVLVLDDHEESLRRLRTKFTPAQVLQVSAAGIPLPERSVDIVTVLDVLEHVERDTAVTRELARVLRPGGIVVATVPASMALWGEWDAALHHFRRYHRPQLRALFESDAWEIVYLNYTNVVIFPAVWLVRKWRAFRPRTDPKAADRVEDRIPPRWLNGLLRAIFVGMARWRMPFPFGVSLLLVARRRG